MTKEECLIHNGDHYLHPEVLAAMDEYAKIKAVEFAKHMNNGVDDRFEERYEWFLKNGSKLGK